MFSLSFIMINLYNQLELENEQLKKLTENSRNSFEVHRLSLQERIDNLNKYA